MEAIKEKKRFKDREIVKRLNSESPDFFKKVQWFGGILITISPLLLFSGVLAPFSAATFAAGSAMVAVGKLPMKGLSLEEAHKAAEKIKLLEKELENLKNK